MLNKTKRLLGFGPFRVDPQQRLLMRGEKTISLQPKAFETLLVLLRHSHQLVTKDELMKEVWPDTFVEESNLTQQVFQLRKALGQTPQDQQYIITVPGRGYRFAQAVVDIGRQDAQGDLVVEEEKSTGHVPLLEKPANQKSSTLAAAGSRPLRQVLSWAFAGVVAISGAFALGWKYHVAPLAKRPLIRVVLDIPEFELPAELTFGANPGLSGIALSPDGTRVVYTGHGADGILRLYTRTLDQEHSLPLLGTEGAYGPFFAPNGRFVAFFADAQLKKISLDNGTVTALSPAPKGYGGSWGQDDSIVAALDWDQALSWVSAQGGAVRSATELRTQAKDIAHLWPQALAHEDAVLFTAISANAEVNAATVEVQSLKTGERRTLVTDAHYGRYVPSGHLLFVQGTVLSAAPMDVRHLALTGPKRAFVRDVAFGPDGSPQFDFSSNGMLTYVRAVHGKQTITWLDPTGQSLPLRSSPGEYLPGIRFSPDGKRIAFALASEDYQNVDIWVYEWEHDSMRRLTFNAMAWFPVWSPDGKHIAYMSEAEGGVGNLYYLRAEGGGAPVRLTENKYRQLPYSFSPDGKRLAFFQISPQTKADIWTVPLEEPQSDNPKAGKPEPLLATEFDERAPVISPDGKWLAYESDETGRAEIFVRRLSDPGGKWQISTAGGDRPVWSKKLPELIFRSKEGVMFTKYAVQGDAFVAGKPGLWTRKSDLGLYFDLSPDGRRLAVLQPVKPDHSKPPQVVLLQNFWDELQRQAPARR